MRRPLAAVIAVASMLGGAAVALSAAAPAAADVFDPLAQVHSEQVTGDFLSVGNGVLVCPGEAGTARTECLAASRRDNSFNNNRFAMEYADVDDDPATYNSSSARVDLPAGARVTYARLQWGGNRDGQQCGIGQPGSYPDGSAATNPVRLSVGGAAPSDVAPEEYTPDTTSVGYYTADAEVTDAFADLPAGGADVTVGNVFAPEGRGCFGGWSLVVVHTVDDADCGAQRREVFVYDGHVRQGVSDPPIEVTADGFRVSGAPARVGVTAYEGDNGQNGDQLLLNGTPLADPVTGSTSNFFASTAQGRIAPDYPNNFSVDAKRLDVPAGLIEPGDTEATLGITTSADAFVLQGLVLSVPVPSLCLEKTVDQSVVRAGDTVTWTLTVRNPSDVDATDVVIDDPAVPDCARTIGDLPSTESETYTCTSTVDDDLTNLATATGTGPGDETLSASATATVDVIDPALEVTKTADVDRAVIGDQVTWTIEVTNTGDSPLDPVTVDDDLVDACDRDDLGRLEEGDAVSYRCRNTVTADLTNTVTATGTPLVGDVVTDTASASVEAVPLAITKTADSEVVVPGQTVTWTITATNLGADPLTGVVADDDTADDCDRTFDLPASGTPEIWTCTTVAGTEDLVNTVTASAAAAPEVSDTATVIVRVPEVAVDLSVDRTEVPTGEDTDLTVVVDNPGETPIRGVDVDVAGAPDCARDGLRLAAGATTTVECSVTVTDDTRLVAAVTAQPVLGGEAAGRRIEATDSVAVDALRVRRVFAPAPASPSPPATTTVTSVDPGGPDGVLPDTGASSPTTALAPLGAVLVLSGCYLLWRRRTGSA